ncbi:MAG: TolC family protein [Leptospira sp.]|nr:TolC family protein [Leptospira sp.]
MLTYQKKFIIITILSVFSICNNDRKNELDPRLAVKIFNNELQKWEDYATKNNPLYLKEKKNIGKARGDLITSSLYYNPVIGLQQQFIGASRNSGPGLPETYATYEQTIDISGVINQRKKVAMSDFQMSIANFSDFDRIFRLRLRQNFLNYIFLSELMKMQESFLSSYNDLIELTKFRAEKGDISFLEYDRIELQKINLEREYKSIKFQRNHAEKQLRILIGHTNLNEVLPSELSLVFQSTEELGIRLDRVNIENRPDLYAMKIQETRERDNIELKKRQATPALRLGGEVMQKGQESYSGVFASIPLPVFDRNQGEIWKAEETYRYSQMNTEAKVNEISLEIQTLVREITDREKQLLEYRKIGLINKNKDVQEKTRLGYVRGAFNLVTFIESEKNYLEVLKKYYELVFLYYNAIEEFKFGSGSLNNYGLGIKGALNE